jgi:hypothetical protein
MKGRPALVRTTSQVWVTTTRPRGCDATPARLSPAGGGPASTSALALGVTGEVCQVQEERHTLEDEVPLPPFLHGRVDLEDTRRGSDHAGSGVARRAPHRLAWDARARRRLNGILKRPQQVHR